MADVVVTIPTSRWEAWLEEGCLPGENPRGARYFIRTAGRPRIEPGERVYVVAHGRLRGYAPLWYLGDELPLLDVKLPDAGEYDIIDKWRDEHRDGFHHYLVRRGGAVAVTIPEKIKGFQGFRYRWWGRKQEISFHEWQTAGVPQREARP